MVDSSKTWTWQFEDDLLEGKLQKRFESCLQCGKCVGSCPAATVSSHYNVRKIVRDLLYGKIDDLLQSNEIWECFLCSNCEVLCPQEEKIPNLIHVLRHEALSRGFGSDLIMDLHPLADSFLKTGSVFRNKGIIQLRERLGLKPIREISEKSIDAIKTICKETGFTSTVKNIKDSAQKNKSRGYIY